MKSIHMLLALSSIGLFVYRGWYLILLEKNLPYPWLRVVPHVNDTVLLGLGVALLWRSEVIAWSDTWLLTKLTLLLLYIVLGMVAMKWAKVRSTRLLAWVAAIALFAYMLAIALSKKALVFT